MASLLGPADRKTFVNQFVISNRPKFLNSNRRTADLYPLHIQDIPVLEILQTNFHSAYLEHIKRKFKNLYVF